MCRSPVKRPTQGRHCGYFGFLSRLQHQWKMRHPTIRTEWRTDWRRSSGFPNNRRSPNGRASPSKRIYVESSSRFVHYLNEEVHQIFHPSNHHQDPFFSFNFFCTSHFFTVHNSAVFQATCIYTWHKLKLFRTFFCFYRCSVSNLKKTLYSQVATPVWYSVGDGNRWWDDRFPASLLALWHGTWMRARHGSKEPTVVLSKINQRQIIVLRSVCGRR